MPHDREIVDGVCDRQISDVLRGFARPRHSFFDSVGNPFFHLPPLLNERRKVSEAAACFCDTPITFHIENLRPTTASLPLSFALLAINNTTE